MNPLKLLTILPKVRAWIETTIAEHAADARDVLSLGFPRLGEYFPAEFLASSYVVVVPVIPLPPLAAFGLPGVEDFEQMDPDGITYLNTFFAKTAYAKDESMHFHELVHVIQWQHLGPDRFLLEYAAGHLANGYRKNPLEAMAYSLHAEFERRSAPIDVVTYVKTQLDARFRLFGSLSRGRLEM